MRRVAVLLCIGLLAVPAVSFAAISNDEVTSQKIKEADNTTAQNTNNGSGVKTGHIQNLAVTGAKIADSAVTSAKIQDGAVAAADLATGAVTTDKIVDNAVTDAKILGVSASKISGTVTNADMVDGLHATALAPASHTHHVSDVTDLDSLYQKKYANVIVVAKSGGDFDTPAAALASIDDATESNPYLVKIMPGTYIGLVGLKDYVDVEGSGANVTKITSDSLGSGSFTLDANEYVQHCEVRDLTIEQTANSGPDLEAKALRISSGRLTLRRVNVVASSTVFSTGIWWAGGYGTLTLIDSDVVATSGGTSIRPQSGRRQFGGCLEDLRAGHRRRGWHPHVFGQYRGYQRQHHQRCD